MKIIKPGHIYELNKLDDKYDESSGGKTHTLKFVERHPNGAPFRAGVTNQEVLRAVIDRVKFMEHQRPWHGNPRILWHLRQALVMHECRQLERMVDKLKSVEDILVDPDDQHFKLVFPADGEGEWK